MTKTHILHRRIHASVPIAVKGYGIEIFDSSGKSYIDASGGAAVSCLGHGHPAVNEAIKSAGWTAQPAYETGAGEVTIEATARTPLWGFPYDVAVRITDEGGTVFIDMRSASRYGRHDLGDNAARIISFYQLLDEKARERL